MLTRKTYTPATIFTALPEPLAAQLVREMVRLRQKLTAAKWEMPYFSRSQVTRPPMGRPLSEPAASFAAILFARLSGHSRKRAQEILAADPNRASGAIWSVAAHAHREGVQTAAEFEAWLQREEEESATV